MISTYLWVNFLSIIIPLIFSFHPKLNFHKNFKAFFLSNIITAILFIAWDIKFTDMQVWGFNPNHLSGINIVNLPIEEVMFFFCIPFACMFTYHSLNIIFNVSWNLKIENIFVLSFSGILLFTGAYFYDKLYTSTTFISLGILLLILKYYAKVNWLAKLAFTYPILLIPFFIVNGVLTGSWIDEPIVWYDNSENLGIRLFTIPIEDVFYGFELIMLNIYFYELIKVKLETMQLNKQYILQ
ncbi:MAG TPA: lycopene cyclase domain-containing protein [Bacteroidia bacterium]|nr:lycopene cyclase domain-containing protein [Bacteroidia bacterium]